TNNAEGQIIFGELTYDEVGKHSYTIREVKGEQGGMTYDESQYSVEVNVTDNGKGKLVATADYVDGPVSFTNSYTPSPDSVVFTGTKVLEGQDLRGDQFEFELVDAEGKVLEVVTNNAEGQIIFGELTYDEVGKHSYTIREVKGEQGGMTYDESQYSVEVNVTDNGKGNLVAIADYVDGPVSFTNSYTPSPDSVVFTGT